MGLQTVKEYVESSYQGLFALPNEGDFADVIFLYDSSDSVLIYEGVHYLKSNEYSGYVDCPGTGCPMCAGRKQKQDRLFIPLYNITAGKIEFFDRSVSFRNRLNLDVFRTSPNPSEFVFRITRRTNPDDKYDPPYTIVRSSLNRDMPISKILEDAKTTYEGLYSQVVKVFTASQLSALVNTEPDIGVPSSDAYAAYAAQPRNSHTNGVSNTASTADSLLPDGPSEEGLDVPGEGEDGVVF